MSIKKLFCFIDYSNTLLNDDPELKLSTAGWYLMTAYGFSQHAVAVFRCSGPVVDYLNKINML